MYMYDQLREDTLFYMFYAAVTMLSLTASCYLLFRRANVIAPDVTPPVRLRRWTAAFFAASALSHLWNLPFFFLTSDDHVMLSYLVGGLLDCMTVGPLAIVILFTMLQDRMRPLWPVAMMVVPFVVIITMCIVTRSKVFFPILYAYFILLAIGLILYMVRALRQYERWLRENYADLEHKEVWQSFLVFAIIMSGLCIYTFDVEGLTYEYIVQVINVVLICYLLWRVETLSDLNAPLADAVEETVTTEHEKDTNTLTMRNNIGPLLKQYCEDPQVYLQYDISLSQLAKQIGINRSYLSKHFSLQGITYNTYINGLRIQHFINLYNEAVATHQLISVQQLACQSGFRSYSTFNAAFKKSMGMTATEWMRNMGTSES